MVSILPWAQSTTGWPFVWPHQECSRSEGDGIGLLQIALLCPEHVKKPHRAWAEYFVVVLVTAVILDVAARSPDFLCHHCVDLCAVDASDQAVSPQSQTPEISGTRFLSVSPLWVTAHSPGNGTLGWGESGGFPCEAWRARLASSVCSSVESHRGPFTSSTMSSLSQTWWVWSSSDSAQGVCILSCCPWRFRSFISIQTGCFVG